MIFALPGVSNSADSFSDLSFRHFSAEEPLACCFLAPVSAPAAIGAVQTHHRCALSPSPRPRGEAPGPPRTAGRPCTKSTPQVSSSREAKRRPHVAMPPDRQPTSEPRAQRRKGAKAQKRVRAQKPKSPKVRRTVAVGRARHLHQEELWMRVSCSKDVLCPGYPRIPA